MDNGRLILNITKFLTEHDRFLTTRQGSVDLFPSETLSYNVYYSGREINFM